MIVPSTLPKPPMITIANALTITGRAGERGEHQHRAEHRAAHAGERRRDHEGEHDQLVGIDAHQARGLAVLRDCA